MQMGRRGFSVAGFADIADDLSFFHTLVQADAGEFVEVGIVVPCARPLDADDFATQSVAPDFGYDTGRRAAYRRVFLGENIHTFMSAPLAARRAPSVVKTLAFNRIGQALRAGGSFALSSAISAFGRGSCLVVQPANKIMTALIKRVFVGIFSIKSVSSFFRRPLKIPNQGRLKQL